MEIANPVSLAYIQFKQQESNSEKLDGLLHVFELLLRLDVLLLANRFLEAEECKDVKIRNMLMAKKFQLGDWYAMLQTLVAILPHHLTFGLDDWFVHLEKKKGTSILQKLVQVRNLRVHGENRMTKEFIDETLENIESLFEYCYSTHPNYGVFVEGNDGRLFISNGEVNINCGPFLLSGILVEQPGSMLIYRGCSGNKLRYGSTVGKDYLSVDTYHEVTSALRKKISPFESINDSVPSSILCDRMSDISSQAIARLIDLKRYKPETTIDRAELNTVFESFLSAKKSLFILDGPSGAGKTTWLCKMAEEMNQNGHNVFFETADRLTELDVPTAIGSILKIIGNLTDVINRISFDSAHKRAIIAIDDIGSTGHGEQILLSLFQWIEKLPSDNRLRIIVTIRNDIYSLFQKRHENAIPVSLVQHYSYPPFNANDLIELGSILPVSVDADKDKVLSIRQEVAMKMGVSISTAARRPGIAKTILEKCNLEIVTSGFSTFGLYEAIYHNDILEIDLSGLPKNMMRARILKRLALNLLENKKQKVEIDQDPELNALLYDARGKRSEDYESLLISQIVVETMEDYVLSLSFTDQTFFEFIASLNLPTNFNLYSISDLCGQSKDFPQTLSVAVFYIIRLLTSKTREYNITLDDSLSPWRQRILEEIAARDTSSLMIAFDQLSYRYPDYAIEFVKQLLNSHEYRLVIQTSRKIIDLLEKDSSHVDEIRFYAAKAFYEIDEYKQAENELNFIENIKLYHNILQLKADVAVGKGDFDKAVEVYKEILKGNESLEINAIGRGFAGLGYVLGRIGQNENAEEYLKKGIDILEILGDNLELAEAHGDIGQIYGKMNRYADARLHLGKSLDINQRLGSLYGIGIVEGLIAEIDIGESNLLDAEARLIKAMRIARITFNRWREAWILQRIAQIHSLTGKQSEADKLMLQAERLFLSIDSPRQ